ncbi:Beta-adaptin-like protein B [Platanthera zijinensis]|uniref:Beta-adaptin-like protein B n=1 Tax=Platanthera zijinensis TaxID=2320716 RepID=A0AAP0BAI5_9ASPA
MVVFQNISPGQPNTLLQVAVKNNQQPVWYFNDKLSLHIIFSEDGRLERANFLETWKSLPDSNEVAKDLPGTIIHNMDAMVEHLAEANLFFVAKHRNANKEIMFVSAKDPRGVPLLTELTASVGVPGTRELCGEDAEPRGGSALLRDVGDSSQVKKVRLA